MLIGSLSGCPDYVLLSPGMFTIISQYVDVGVFVSETDSKIPLPSCPQIMNLTTNVAKLAPHSGTLAIS